MDIGENDGHNGQRLSSQPTLASVIGKYIITILGTEPIIFNELIKIMNTQHNTVVKTVTELKEQVKDLNKSMDNMTENITLVMEQSATTYIPIPLSISSNTDPRPAPYVQT